MNPSSSKRNLNVNDTEDPPLYTDIIKNIENGNINELLIHLRDEKTGKIESKLSCCLRFLMEDQSIDCRCPNCCNKHAPTLAEQTQLKSQTVDKTATDDSKNMLDMKKDETVDKEINHVIQQINIDPTFHNTDFNVDYLDCPGLSLVVEQTVEISADEEKHDHLEEKCKIEQSFQNINDHNEILEPMEDVKQPGQFLAMQSTVEFDEKSFKCAICSRSYNQKHSLNRHMLKHGGVRPYKCPHCERSFAQKSDQKKHLYTHTNERRHVCEKCGKRFTLKYCLVRHLKKKVDCSLAISPSQEIPLKSI